jgi:hypothetical protein
VVLELTDRCTTDALQKRYVPEQPNTQDFIVFDQVNKSSVMALSREKYIALLTNQARISRDPDFLVFLGKELFFCKTCCSENGRKIDALLTIETWTHPDEFLAMVMSRYVGPEASSPDRAEFEKSAKSVQGAVVKVLFEWINNPLMAHDFYRSFGLKEMLLQFSQQQSVSLRSLNVSSRAGSAIGLGSGGGRGRSGSIIESSSNTRARREESVLELPVNNVAEQLSLIEYSLLTEIRLSELCGQAWNKSGKEEKAKNVLQLRRKGGKIFFTLFDSFFFFFQVHFLVQSCLSVGGDSNHFAARSSWKSCCDCAVCEYWCCVEWDEQLQRSGGTFVSFALKCDRSFEGDVGFGSEGDLVGVGRARYADEYGRKLSALSNAAGKVQASRGAIHGFAAYRLDVSG